MASDAAGKTPQQLAQEAALRLATVRQAAKDAAAALYAPPAPPPPPAGSKP